MTINNSLLQLHPKELLLRPTPETSDAPRIVLFHGITGSPAELYDLAHYLHDRNFYVFVPCLSGHEGGIATLKTTPAAAWQNDWQRAYQIIQPLSRGPLYVGGLSFGALLALFAATRHPSEIHGLVMASLPLRLQPLWKELLLRALSYLPDPVLNQFGTVKKTPRPYAQFIRNREALEYHSIASAARVLQIRRAALREAYQIRVPVLLLQDPLDHHLSASGPELLARKLKNTTVCQRWFPGGLHELTIGPRHAEVFIAISEFLANIQASARDKG